jgi:hypothetical protein
MKNLTISNLSGTFVSALKVKNLTVDASALTGARSATFPDKNIVVAGLDDIAGMLDPSLFYKANAFSPAFTKTAAGTISVKAGTSAMVAGVMLAWASDTAVTMPTLTGGTDYAVYACTLWL